jgi:hypothetical protein
MPGALHIERRYIMGDDTGGQVMDALGRLLLLGLLFFLCALGYVAVVIGEAL